MTLADRVFTCGCGHTGAPDTNAATNLARWGRTHHPNRSPDPQAGGRATTARRRDGSGQHPRVGDTSPADAGTEFTPRPRPEPRNAREWRCRVHTAPAA
ncbi:hypothetical protein MSM1_17095 [Mycobacterium sp. SM1]|nr:hypothetical protein [Mycobacterium sp. SM1]